jgi:hypothetical protein
MYGNSMLKYCNSNTFSHVGLLNLEYRSLIQSSLTCSLQCSLGKIRNLQTNYKSLHHITSEGNLQYISLPYNGHNITYVYPTFQQEQDSSLIIRSFTKCMNLKVMSVLLFPYFLEKKANVLNKAPY